MATVALTRDNFEEVITNNLFVVVDFWAPWCGPCRSFAPVYEEVSEKHPGVVFAKVNTEEQQELAAHFEIRSIPTIMLFREQVILYSQPGALPANQLNDLIQKAGEIDMAEVHRELAAEQKG